MPFYVAKPPRNQFTNTYDRTVLANQYNSTELAARDILAAAGSVESSDATATVQNRQLLLSINNAISRVTNANGWDWRINWAGLYLEDYVMFYDLPSDFAWFNTPPVPVGDTVPALAHQEYEDMIRYNRGLHMQPDEVMDHDLHSHQVDEIRAEMLAMGHAGIATRWCIRGNKLILFPIPVEAKYIELVGGGFNDYDAASMMMSYFSAPQRMTEIGQKTEDLIRLPTPIYPAFLELATAYFKHMIEQSDFVANEQRGERLLQMAVAGGKRLYPEDAYSRFRLTASGARGGVF